MEERLVAIRGATTADSNSAEEVVRKTGALLQKMMELNGVEEKDLVSIIFTATGDITAEFPAAAARTLGLTDVPLLGAQEISVDGSPARCIRVLIHCYSTRSRSEIKHVYEGDAKRLREDLAAEEDIAADSPTG